MKKQIEITVPNDWSAVSFKKYLRLQQDLKNYGDEEGAQELTLLYHLCDIPPQLVKGLDTKTLNHIKDDLAGFMGKSEGYELQRIVRIGDKEYGFEPNLSQMAYGAYLDMTSYENIELNDDWCEILAILYRPITKKVGALYEIEKYNGVNPWDADKFMDLGMDFHFGSFFFFTRLSNHLLTSTLKYMESQTEMYPNIKSILQESGKVMHQLQQLQEKTS